jgi:hypothetical protein
MDMARLRLQNQHLTGTKFASPADVVQWLGAVQAQDYAGAKWAVGQRMDSATDAALDQAFAEGTILRTHVMRPTWHFVTPADIRWLLALTAPRINATNGYRYRELALDDALFARSNAMLARALAGGTHLTRAELSSIFRQAGIATDDRQITYIMFRAELDGVICSGVRRGKQFTYALLDERAPLTKPFTRDEALAELTRRYFTSHGPATVRDFAWWSGLTMADAKAGLAMVTSQLMQDVVDGRAYWFTAPAPIIHERSPTVSLLPNYDEYIVGYTDRRAALAISPTEHLDARGNILFHHTIVLDGQIVGIWRRILTKRGVTVEATPFTPLDADEALAVAVAVEGYGRFIGLPAALRTPVV